MTAAAIDYRADRIVMAADSAVYDDDGVVHGYHSKVHVLPTIRAVFFARGKLAITNSVMRQLLLDPRLHSIEDAAEALPGVLRNAAEAWADDLNIDLPTENYFECILAGWSEAEGRMRNWQFMSQADFEPNNNFDRMYGGVYAWPQLPLSYTPLDRSQDSVEQKCVATLRAIDRWCTDNAEQIHGIRLGGDMHCVTLTEAGADYSTIGTFFEAKPRAPVPSRKPQKKGRR